MKVTIELKPRPAFKEFLHSKHRWACIVAHRRAGKTFAVLQKLIKIAFEYKRSGPPPRFAVISPTREQTKDICWAYLKEFVAAVPQVEINESELKITLPNKTTIRLYSGNNFERLRGLYLDGVIVDEPADVPPAAWSQVIRPCLSDYQGFAWFIGTPKGKDAFYKRHQQAQESPEWYSALIRASDSGILPPEELKSIRDDYTVSEADYRQEYECDFSIGRPGAIYAADINRAEDEGRIGPFPIDDSALVHTTWDLGAPANTCVIYWSRVGLTYRILDCDMGLEMKTGERVAHMLAKGYNYGYHFLPHDGDNKHADNMSFSEKLTEAGLTNVRSLPRGPHGAEEKRIRMMTDIFSQLWFHESLAGEGGLLEALSAYHRKEARLGGYIENKIAHDWASHPADAFGYISEALQNKMIPELQATQSYGRGKQRSIGVGNL
jgi:phage terminase large subunit